MAGSGEIQIPSTSSRIACILTMATPNGKNVDPHEVLLTIVKRRILQWYGRVSGSSGLAKNHLAKHSERGKKTRQTEEDMGR